ncbi:MAG: GYD domain-containing protein [Pseudomonadota bacterium]
MPTYVVTGCYSSQAAADMIANPRDREGLARTIVESAGGALHSFHVTTGATDILMMVEVDDVESLIAGLIVGAGSGNFTRLETQRAFTSDEFTAIQAKAQQIANPYS